MANNAQNNFKKSLPILQEAFECGVVPKTGAVTFEVVGKRCGYDCVLGVEMNLVNSTRRLATIVCTTTPLEGSLKAYTSSVAVIEGENSPGHIPYDTMKNMLEAIGAKAQNVLVYRNDAAGAQQRDVHENEIRAITDYFQGAHVTFVEVTSRISLRILDVDYPPVKGN